MCYIGHITSRTRPCAPLWPLWVPVKTIEQGRGSFRAQAVSQKTRKKSASKNYEESRRGQPQRNQGPCQGVREGCQEGCGYKVLQEQKKRNARQDCKDCRESDGFEDRLLRRSAAKDCPC